MITSNEGFDTTFITHGKRRKCYDAQVEFTTAGSRPSLKISKLSKKKKTKVLEEIELEDIAAIVSAKLEHKKKPDDDHLLLFYQKKSQTSGWCYTHLSSAADNSVTFKAVREKLRRQPYTKHFQLKSADDGGLYELQCSKRFVAIVSLNFSFSKYSAIDDFCSNISGYIYNKSSKEIVVLPQEDSSQMHTIKFRTVADNTIRTYQLLHCITYDRVYREFQEVKMLPNIPKSQEISNEALQCRPPTLPRLVVDPKWFGIQVPAFSPQTVYRDLDELAPFLPKKLEHIGLVLSRPPSQRFNQFLRTARFDPSSIDSDAIPHQEIYEPPKLLHRLSSECSNASTESFSDHVESTLSECLNNVAKGGATSTDHCPLGMTKFERQTFCWQLDLVEYDVEQGAMWKTFASHVMLLDHDDLDMFDEFSCKYRYQVVEIILDHWYKLHVTNSHKCKLPAVKQTVISVLNLMQRDRLLDKLGWPIDE